MTGGNFLVYTGDLQPKFHLQALDPHIQIFLDTPIGCPLYMVTELNGIHQLTSCSSSLPYSSFHLLSQWMVSSVIKLIKFHLSKDYVCLRWGTILCLAQCLDHVLWKVLIMTGWMNEWTGCIFSSLIFLSRTTHVQPIIPVNSLHHFFRSGLLISIPTSIFPIQTT